MNTRLISSLTSDIRRTLRPDLALEKMYHTLSAFAELSGFYFFKRLINTDDHENIFKGYSLYFKSARDELSDFSEEKIFDVNEIRELGFVDKSLEVQIFQSKVRGREWGLLVATREQPWTPELIEIFELFSEQMATVFNQHELHSESLTMAQREFLLNQITTKIRESLVVDKIIETAVEEIGQVMGVESCGMVILNRKISGSISHQTWSIEDEFSLKMTDAIYSTLGTELEPNWQEPSMQAAQGVVEYDMRSYMCCGLFRDNTRELIGILAVGFFNQVRIWTRDEQLLLEGVAKQLEIALIQASIYQEAQQTKRQMALLHKLSSDIRDSLDISIVLGQIANGIGEVLGLSRCFVRRFSADSKVIRTEEEYCAQGFDPSADMMFNFEREWMANDVLNITSVESKLREESPELLKIAQAIKLKSYLSIPLVARGKLLGSIIVHQCDRERNFLPEEIEFIYRVGSEAAIAIEHAELFETINKFNKTDPDTGLYNKRYFREVAMQEIAKAQANSNPISFMLVDVDYLKEINDDPDCGGHEAGDEAIQMLATVLTNTVRQTPVDEVSKRISDIVGRFGGDEFMILLPNTPLEGAITVANRIAERLARAKHSTWPKALTCSIGISSAPHDPYDYEQLKTLADKALYLSKHKGRNAFSTTVEL
jgi:diguanylate cyclase (GGDEF)-like protein